MVPLEIVGMFTAEMTYKESTIRENIYVLKNQHIGLLSRNMSIKLGLVKLIGEIHPHKELFEGLGKLKRKYKTQINRNVKPYSILYQDLYQYIYKRELRRWLKEL